MPPPPQTCAFAPNPSFLRVYMTHTLVQVSVKRVCKMHRHPDGNRSEGNRRQAPAGRKSQTGAPAAAGVASNFTDNFRLAVGVAKARKYLEHCRAAGPQSVDALSAAVADRATATKGAAATDATAVEAAVAYGGAPAEAAMDEDGGFAALMAAIRASGGPSGDHTVGVGTAESNDSGAGVLALPWVADFVEKVKRSVHRTNTKPNALPRMALSQPSPSFVRTLFIHSHSCFDWSMSPCPRALRARPCPAKVLVARGVYKALRVRAHVAFLAAAFAALAADADAALAGLKASDYGPWGGHGGGAGDRSENDDQRCSGNAPVLAVPAATPTAVSADAGLRWRMGRDRHALLLQPAALLAADVGKWLVRANTLPTRRLGLTLKCLTAMASQRAPHGLPLTSRRVARALGAWGRRLRQGRVAAARAGDPPLFQAGDASPASSSPVGVAASAGGGSGGRGLSPAGFLLDRSLAPFERIEEAVAGRRLWKTARGSSTVSAASGAAGGATGAANDDGAGARAAEDGSANESLVELPSVEGKCPCGGCGRCVG